MSDLFRQTRFPIILFLCFSLAFPPELLGQIETREYDSNGLLTKITRFGRRRIDIEVWKNGKCLGGIETKTGSSRYTPEQHLRDAWLQRLKNYIVTVVRDG